MFTHLQASREIENETECDNSDKKKEIRRGWRLSRDNVPGLGSELSRTFTKWSRSYPDPSKPELLPQTGQREDRRT